MLSWLLAAIEIQKQPETFDCPVRRVILQMVLKGNKVITDKTPHLTSDTKLPTKNIFSTILFFTNFLNQPNYSTTHAIHLYFLLIIIILVYHAPLAMFTNNAWQNDSLELSLIVVSRGVVTIRDIVVLDLRLLVRVIHIVLEVISLLAEVFANRLLISHEGEDELTGLEDTQHPLDQVRVVRNLCIRLEADIRTVRFWGDMNSKVVSLG